MQESPIIVALDFPRSKDILDCARRLDPKQCRVKIGFESFLTAGPGLVENLQKAGFDVFLDLKFHDIPNTVAAACRVAASLGVWMINVHASGGQRMMEAAAESLAGTENPPLLIAVTVLTSMSFEDLSQTGLAVEPAEQVNRLAEIAQQSGMDGVVCSAQEAGMLRASRAKDFLLVTPGIRPAGSDKGDQHRVMTPAKAIQAGSSYLVIGRPVTQASDPGNAVNEILITLY